MKTHTFARLFPVITGPDFDALVADIKANGLREKITTLGGMILDGQNRFLACEAAGVKPEYEPYEGPDPLAFVISRNMARRHLTDDQRAAIAAEIAKALNGKPVNMADSVSQAPTIAKAAEVMKVKPRQVRLAKAVKAESPAAFQAVKEGKLSLNAAHEQTHPRKVKESPAPIYTCDPITGAVETAKPIEPPDIPADLPVVIGKPLSKITPHEFSVLIGDLEERVNEAYAGNQAERTKFGVIANAMAGRLMNPPPTTSCYTR